MTSHEIAFTFAERFQANYPKESLIDLTEQLRKEIDEYAEEKVRRSCYQIYLANYTKEAIIGSNGIVSTDNIEI